ncbi:hypothetical protein LPJ56_005565 [Coemansia sp. RSA 2599]|nr:hypothetical protein LPJ56_005565 [Coemansia sp. RSA 2599]
MTRQEVVLADNVNQPPSEQHTAFDVFSGAGASKGSSDTLAMHQEITCASFVLMRPRSDTDGQQQSVQPNLKEFLLVGTSAGLVLQYPVEGEIDPPNLAMTMAWDS